MTKYRATFAPRSFARISGAPAGVLALQREDQRLELKGQAVGLPVRWAAVIAEALKTAILVRVKIS